MCKWSQQKLGGQGATAGRVVALPCLPLCRLAPAWKTTNKRAHHMHIMLADQTCELAQPKKKNQPRLSLTKQPPNSEKANGSVVQVKIGQYVSMYHNK